MPLPFPAILRGLGALLLAVPLALRAADSRAPATFDAPHAANPILPGYYADPSLVQHNGHAYLYATLDPWGDHTLGCWESTDFKNWTYHLLNWPTKEACTSKTSSGSMVWAPSVVRAPNGKFFMYVSVGSEVWVGTADTPLGPWHDAHGGQPLISHDYKPGFHMIDAEAFIDDDGSAYLYWGSGWSWKNGRCFAVKLRPDMVTFDGEPRDVTPRNYFEGPFMFKRAGRYYLTYSQGITVKDTYAVHYAVGKTPFGPFIEAATSPILSTDAEHHIVSPGHHAIFSREGRTYILYHRHSVPYVPDQAYRQTCVDELRFAVDDQIVPVLPTHTGPALIQHRATPSLAATASASSSLDALHSPSHVLDDNYATRWSAATGDTAPTLTLDLGAIHPIAHQQFRFEYAWKTYRFVLETSRDGEKWTLLANRRTGITGSPVRVDALVTARYLRLVFARIENDSPPSVFEWSVQ